MPATTLDYNTICMTASAYVCNTTKLQQVLMIAIRLTWYLVGYTYDCNNINITPSAHDCNTISMTASAYG